MLQQVFISLAWTQLDFLAPLNGLLSFTGRLRCDETLPSPNWTMAGIQFRNPGLTWPGSSESFGGLRP